MSLLRLVGLILVVAIVGPLVWAQHWLPRENDVVVSITAFAIAALTFFGIAHLNRASRSGRFLGDEGLRTAIAAAIVVTYLFLVCFTAFVKSADQAGYATQSFVESFSQVVSVTIAFYFGASTATQIFGKKNEGESSAKVAEASEDETKS